MWMQMVLFTLLFPVLPYVLWKCYNKEKKPERGEAVLRYVIYALLITFLSAIVLTGHPFGRKSMNLPSLC